MIFDLPKKVLLTGKIVSLWRRSTVEHCDTTDIEEIHYALKHIWSGRTHETAEGNWFRSYFRDMKRTYRKDYI